MKLSRKGAKATVTHGTIFLETIKDNGAHLQACQDESGDQPFASDPPQEKKRGAGWAAKK